MRGFAAELSGARDWMKVATAWLVGESGINPYTLKIKNRLVFKMSTSFALRGGFSSVNTFSEVLNERNF